MDMFLMNVNGIFREKVGKAEYYSNENRGGSPHTNKDKLDIDGDTIEISDEAYAAQQDNQMTATSGEDILGISKGDKENTFIIHFADSAMVSRAVSRGYITVNGSRIELTDEIKEKMKEISEQAEEDRKAAFNDYVLQHELAVSLMQEEAWKKAAEESAEAIAIAEKISSGRPIRSSEAQKLMEFDPQLYAMAMSVAAMTKNQEKQEFIRSDQKPQIHQRSVEGVDWSQFDWKTYDSRITVSTEDNEVEDVYEGEIILNPGRSTNDVNNTV